MSCLCAQYAKATEWAALAGARWLGRADEEAAEEAASSGMKAALDDMQIDGSIVIGGRVEQQLAPGASIGAGGEPVDLAVDPLEGGGLRPDNLAGVVETIGRRTQNQGIVDLEHVLSHPCQAMASPRPASRWRQTCGL